jgi:hypothetical protein
MKIDFIQNDSQNAPILRLFTVEKAEIEFLQSCLNKLTIHEKTEVNISELPISQTDIRVLFRWNKLDLGMRINRTKTEFILELAEESWLEIMEKLDPFLENQSGYTWLYNSSLIHMLFTTDGEW